MAERDFTQPMALKITELQLDSMVVEEIEPTMSYATPEGNINCPCSWSGPCFTELCTAPPPE